jgi:hypothetical protein
MNITLKLAAHSLITAGGALMLLPFVGLNADELVLIWLVFTGVALFADWLLLTPARRPLDPPRRQSSVWAYFEEMRK